MAIKRSYDSQEDIPEGMEALYHEQGGKWVLDMEDDSGSKNAEDVRRIQAARDKERDEASKLRKEIAALKEKIGDIDLDRLPEAKEALAKAEEFEQEKLISEKRYQEAAEQKYKRQVAELNRQLEATKAEIDTHKQSHAQLSDSYRKIRIQEALGKEFLGAGIDPEFLDAAITMEGSRWEIDPETREPVPVEFIDSGKTKVTARGADGNPLTMKEHARTFLRDKPRWALNSNGSNSVHQNGTTGSGYSITRTEARDIRKYELAKANAQKAGQELQIIE